MVLAYLKDTRYACFEILIRRSPAMFVRVKNGLKIRDPLTKQMIPEEGGHVVDSIFWQRRLRDGDIEILPEPAAPKESE